jgi:endonuclease YncB( thermonuclease family)
MTTVRLWPAIALLAALWAPSTLAQTKPSPWFPIPQDAIYETGDTWIAGGKRYRLYGVQSCLRATSFTNAKGVKRDCGEASLAMLVSLVRDLRPMCYAAANIDYGRTVLVFCFATMEQGRNKGSRLDLGTALISIGYAFASVTLDGRPVYSPYLIAETQAKNTKSGLWAFPDMPDPNAIILENYKPPNPAGTSPVAGSSARDEKPR